MRCPYCNKEFAPSPEIESFRPFCSKRCKVADLGAWASGRYSIPVVETDDLEMPTDEELGGSDDE